MFARHAKLFFEAHETPNATHTMVSAPPLCRKNNLYSICSALGRPSRTVSDRKTLRAYGEIVRGPSGHPFHAACRRARRYVCAASALLAAEMYCDLLIRSHRGPRNVTHAIFFAFSMRFHETLHTYLFQLLLPRRMHPFGLLRPPDLRGRRVL